MTFLLSDASLLSFINPALEMLAHLSLSHLSDPIVALSAGGLILLYTLWRTVLRPRLQENGTVDQSPETNPAASPSSVR